MLRLNTVKDLYTSLATNPSDSTEAYVLKTMAEGLSPVAERYALDNLDKLPQRVQAGVATLLGKSAQEVVDVEDDSVVIRGNGFDVEDTQFRPYERGYAATYNGPLRQAHGSQAPATIVLNADQLAALRSQSPGQALNKMAALRRPGVADFEAMAQSKQFYDPSAERWWGKCHAWAATALIPKLNQLVDVPGRAGERGLWFAGEWISRADLGTWLMGLADRISLKGAGVTDSDITAMDLLRITQIDLAKGGNGFAADVHLDVDGKREVWNQPFFRSTSIVHEAEAKDVEAVLQVARAEGGTNASKVYRLEVSGYYGIERGDDYEDAPGGRAREWTIWAACDAEGRVTNAYLSDDEKLRAAGVTSYPTQTTLEWTYQPRAATYDAAFNGTPDFCIDHDPLGRAFRFFVGDVLAKGVTGSKRAAFERRVSRLAASATDADVVSLKKRYAGIANAYTPEQWAQHFEPRGLRAADFT